MGSETPKSENPPCSKQELYEHYWGQLKYTTTIAQRYGETRQMVRNWLDYYSIPRRTKKLSADPRVKTIWKHGYNPNDACGLGVETLHELYWDEQLSIADIADRCDCAPSTVRKRLIWYDIDRRPLGTQMTGPKSGIRRDWVVGDDADKKALLYELYWGQLLDAPACAQKLDVHPQQVRDRLRTYGIPRRSGDNGDDWRVAIIDEYDDTRSDGVDESNYDIHNSLAWLFEDCDGSDPQRSYGSKQPWIHTKGYWYHHYWDRGLTTHEISALWHCDLSSTAARDQMEQLGIPRRRCDSKDNWDPDSGEIPSGFELPETPDWLQQDTTGSVDPWTKAGGD